MYNFADSSVTASAFTSGANTALTLVATTAGLTTTAALVIYYDDQLASTTVTVSSLPAISGTVTVGNTVSFISVASDDELTANISNAIQGSPLPAGTNQIGTVTANLGNVAGTHQADIPSRAVRMGWGAEDTFKGVGVDAGGQPLPIQIHLGISSDDNVTTANPLPISGTVTIGSCVTHGVTIANSSVTVNGTFFQGTQPVSLATLPALVAGTAQIGSVTASISGTVPVSISSVTVGNSVTIGSLPAISGTVTANTFAIQGTAVTTSNFTSITPSTVLASFNATREVLTIFNEGAGNLFVSAGATCTTVQYQVRLSAGDYYEVPNHQTTITHSAVFATAGTARVTEVS
jgi:hypothetical protein